MRVSQLLTKTFRQDPSEAETDAHRLMLKAGLIHRVASGIYAYLPLAQRTLRKIHAIVRQEMDAIGGQEIRMPALQPVELWQETGRDSAFGESLFRLSDRRQRSLVLAPTHEEVVTLLVHHHVQSYRDLPLILYQIQTKFRDELRPRAGLVRGREFEMKDAYSFDLDQAGLDISYEKTLGAYRNIFSRCGLPCRVVEADSGAIGGKDSHEFILPSYSGEDTIIVCDSCGYAANAERAIFLKTRPEPEPLIAPEEVHTPNTRTINDLSQFLGIPSSKTLKAIFYRADGEIIIVTIRGDLDVNEVKLQNYLGCSELRLANDDELTTKGLTPGFASLVGLKQIRSICDDSIYLGTNFVVGANRSEYHIRNTNPGQDFSPGEVLDIAMASPGDGCPHCGRPLHDIRGIEIGHLFKLGSLYSIALQAYFLDRNGTRQPAVMGCYGIGITRMLAGIIQQNHDDKGIVWPPSVAPFQIHLLGINLEQPLVNEAAEALYQGFLDIGLEVLYDDRIESPGVKFNDADLLGLPIRVLVSTRTLASQEAEMRFRVDGSSRRISLATAPEEVLGTLPPDTSPRSSGA